MSSPNIQRVRILYKTILKLHKGLPPDLGELGTKYAREEFKRHKKCNVKEADIFIKEWTNYALSLGEQLGLKDADWSKIGASLSESDLEKFRDEQIVQLHELLEATRGPTANKQDEKQNI